MKISTTRILLATFVGLLFVTAPAHAGVRVVNCDDGDSLLQAIESGAGSAKPIEIELLGTCYEDVQINRDDVSVYGNGDTTIVGTVRAFGKNLSFEGLTITGSGHGLFVVNGRALLTNVHLSGNDNNGITLFQNATISLFDCRVEHNGGAGISLNDSTTRIRNTFVENNGGDGIVLANNAVLRFTGGGINVHENGYGIRATRGATVDLRNTHIGWANPTGLSLSLGSSGSMVNSWANANAEIGVLVEYNSTLEVSGGGISWNGLYGAYVLGHSVLILDNADAQFNNAHGVVVEADSALFAKNGATVMHNWAFDGQQVECRDEESSLSDDGNVYIDPPPITCTGF